MTTEEAEQKDYQRGYNLGFDEGSAKGFTEGILYCKKLFNEYLQAMLKIGEAS